MKIIGSVRSSAVTAALVLAASAVTAQTWRPLATQPGFAAGATLLLTDGTVLVHNEGSDFQAWYKLTPDANGSYVNGSWSQVASLPAGYAPLYFGSAVLPDGRVIVEGGEYNFGVPTWTNLGAIYDPVLDMWTSVAPPSGWKTIGDAQSSVLADGTFMQSNCCTKEAALLDPATLTWTSTGTGKFDVYDEEGWTLLPSGQLLTVDAYVFQYDASGTNSEIYTPATGAWTGAGSTVVQLWDSHCGDASRASFEVGPAVLRPDKTVFAMGSNGCGAAHNAIYDTRTGAWKAAPDFPQNLGVSDGPAALETNGKVLIMASNRVFKKGAKFVEWNGTSFTTIAGPPGVRSDSSFYGHFLQLPTGELLFSDFSSDMEVFTPAGSYDPAWRPTIATSPRSVTRGETYTAAGTQFNGLSQGATYGDDYQPSTNYPLVRIVNRATGHVFYCRTHDHSSMGVATGGKRVTTRFDVPVGAETGASDLVVVANGIPSTPVQVTVQ
jgi:hypothetical protein